VIQERNGVLYINPGSAGPRRFGASASLALLEVQDNLVSVQPVSLDT
jgi:predicted phosphodiesterase